MSEKCQKSDMRSDLYLISARVNPLEIFGSILVQNS